MNTLALVPAPGISRTMRAWYSIIILLGGLAPKASGDVLTKLVASDGNSGPEKRYLRSSASEQDLLAAKEPVQFDDVAHGQESLVALSGDSSSSDVEAAASLKDRFLRSSASAQDIVAAKEPEQLLYQDTRRLSVLFAKLPYNRRRCKFHNGGKDGGKRRCKKKKAEERKQWIMAEVAIVLGFLFILAIAYVCIKRRRTKAAAARVDVDVEAPLDRDDAFAGDGLEARSVKELKAEAGDAMDEEPAVEKKKKKKRSKSDADEDDGVALLEKPKKKKKKDKSEGGEEKMEKKKK